MKKWFIGALVCATVSALNAAEAPSELKSAVEKLKGQPNYSWTTKTEMPGSQFTPGPVKGQTEKGGFTVISYEMNNNTMQAVKKGDKAAVKVEDEWKLASELETSAQGGGGPNRGAFAARMASRAQAPADQLADLLGKVAEIKKGDAGVYAGDLTEAGAKELLTFGRRRPNAPEPKDAKASVKIWVKSGQLAKFEITVEGKVVNQNQEEREIKSIRTTEIEDVGSTKVEVPAGAKAKLSS